MILALVLLAVVAAVLFGAGFVIKWLFVAAAIVALVWVILLLTSGLRRAA